MGKSKTNNKSEIMKCIRIIIESCDFTASEVAFKAGMSPQALYDFINKSKGTQLVKAEKILNVLGYDLVLKPLKQKKEEKS
jgi:predicted DNA-binding protein YlxM (UPF0122 family)